MKKIFKVILLTIIISSFWTNIASANERIIGSANTYEEALKQIIVHEPDSTEVFNSVMGSVTPELPPIVILQGGKEIKGTFIYPDYDSTTLGIREVHWIFTPEDTTIDPISGIVNVNIVNPINDQVEEITAPSLTATTVTLNNMTTYDINLNDKVSGSTYLWTSSDTEVVEVNSKSGLLKAKSEGEAIVTCEITFPDKSTQILQSEVTVGYDANAPVLTETAIDLETGNVFDINLENKVAKSKYRWASSDRSIVTVNSSNGKVTAKAPGTAYVTCTITTPENQVIVLRADITVMAQAVETE